MFLETDASYAELTDDEMPSEVTYGSLTVQSPAAELAAEFISRPQNQEVVEGQKAEFSCTVSKETFDVKWMKENVELQMGDRYQMVSDGKRRSLIIKDCVPKDEGGYTVVIGTTRASADLTVHGKFTSLHEHLALNMSVKTAKWVSSLTFVCFVQRN